MALRLTYLLFSKLLAWMVLHTRSDTTKEIEIHVLRHQIAVLQRRTSRPPTKRTDRALITALSRGLPVRLRIGLLATPSTILRWHQPADGGLDLQQCDAVEVGRRGGEVGWSDGFWIGRGSTRRRRWR